MTGDSFEEREYYLHGRADRGGHLYGLHRPTGELVLAALVPGIPAEIALYPPGEPDRPRLRMVPRPMFPLRGTYDVVGAPGGARLGSLTRAGAILDAGERPLGRIDDPTSLASRAAEGVAGAVLDGVLAGADGVGGGHRATVLHLTVGDRVAGVCRAVALPFEPAGEGDAPGSFSPRRFLERHLPERARRVLDRALTASGWHLDFTADAAGALPGPLRLAAVLFRVELERRYRA
jgi:hypothetical protein